MNLVLIGYRGTGKSTIAQRLALALAWDWIDADVELELRAGASIATIFAEQGEPAFRDLESQVLADLATRHHTVIAAGGGVVLRPANREVLRRLGQIVWLRADADTIAQRLAADDTTHQRRPNLTAGGGRAEIEQLLAAREPLYAATAHVTVDTTNLPSDALVAAILGHLRSRD